MLVGAPSSAAYAPSSTALSSVPRWTGRYFGLLHAQVDVLAQERHVGRPRVAVVVDVAVDAQVLVRHRAALVDGRPRIVREADGRVAPADGERARHLEAALL